MVGQRPEELKSDIAQRREQMGDTLDAIGDRVSPGQIAGRQKALMRRRVTGWRYSIMAVTDAPEAARRQAQGNPMAAGLVAFGAGLLIATVLPESETEKQAVQQVQPQLEQAASQAGEVADTAKQSAQEHGEELKGSVTDAAQQVKQEASDAAQDVKEHAQGAAQDVKGEAQAAKDRAGS